jgi:hypothetical protein
MRRREAMERKFRAMGGAAMIDANEEAQYKATAYFQTLAQEHFGECYPDTWTFAADVVFDLVNEKVPNVKLFYLEAVPVTDGMWGDGI